MGALFENTFGQQKDAIIEKGRSEAPRGMLFEGILEPLGRQIVENGGYKNTFVFLLGTEKGSRSRAVSQERGGVGPFN